MFKFLKKPYPFNNDLKYNAKLILFISIGVLAYFYLIQPFDISTFSKRQLTYLVGGFAASTFLILSINLIFLPSFFPKLFDTNKWNIKREIIWNLWSILTISTNYFILNAKFLGLSIITGYDILRIIFFGSIPVVAIIVINHNRLLRLHLRTAQQLTSKLLDNKLKKEKLISFESDYKKDGLILKADSVILIKSADNYVEIYYKTDSEIKKQLIRSSLKSIEILIAEFDFIFKCHRSFIINIKHIKEIQGNSLGYKVFFDGVEFPALVSQTYIDAFKKLI